MGYTEYKTGDRVVVTDDCALPNFRGMRGTVVRIWDRDNIRVQLDLGNQVTLMLRSLRLLAEAVPPSPAATMPLLPHDSAERKQIPLYSVLFGYFPDAMIALAKHSYESNEKHNPGEELHWSRGKSDDHQDAAMRHLVEGDHVGLLWRAAALLQLDLEKKGHAVAPAAR